MKKLTLVASLSALALVGCASDGTRYRADTYHAMEVNQAQRVRTVDILAIGSAKIALPEEMRSDDVGRLGMIIGAIAGAAIGNQSHHFRFSNRMFGGFAGAVVGHVVGDAMAGSGSGVNYVDGVQLTFRYKDKLYNSAQVGQPCEYKTGLAVMISTSPTETRIQPNNPGACPVQQ